MGAADSSGREIGADKSVEDLRLGESRSQPWAATDTSRVANTDPFSAVEGLDLWGTVGGAGSTFNSVFPSKERAAGVGRVRLGAGPRRVVRGELTSKKRGGRETGGIREGSEETKDTVGTDISSAFGKSISGLTMRKVQPQSYVELLACWFGLNYHGVCVGCRLRAPRSCPIVPVM